MNTFTELYPLFIALGIGLLIGMQRQYAFFTEKNKGEALFAGTRTFPLLALSGWISAFSADYLQTPLLFPLLLMNLQLLADCQVQPETYQ